MHVCICVHVQVHTGCGGEKREWMQQGSRADKTIGRREVGGDDPEKCGERSTGKTSEGGVLETRTSQKSLLPDPVL